MKTQEPETLLDAMVTEGMADAFATALERSVSPPWIDALTPEQEGRLWPRVQRRLALSETTEIRRVLFGDNDRIPVWTGYTFGYRIVASYMKANQHVRPAGLASIPASVIYEASNYRPGP